MSPRVASDILYTFSVIKILYWNVRGLGLPSKRRLVRRTIKDSACNVFCLQETKLAQLDRKQLISICGERFDASQVLNANGTSGGLLTAWDPSSVDGRPFHFGKFPISTEFRSYTNLVRSVITNVYGPHDYNDRKSFFAELEVLSCFIIDPWAIVGHSILQDSLLKGWVPLQVLKRVWSLTHSLIL